MEGETGNFTEGFLLGEQDEETYWIFFCDAQKQYSLNIEILKISMTCMHIKLKLIQKWLDVFLLGCLKIVICLSAGGNFSGEGRANKQIFDY